MQPDNIAVKTKMWGTGNFDQEGLSYLYVKLSVVYSFFARAHAVDCPCADHSKAHELKSMSSGTLLPDLIPSSDSGKI